MKTLKKKRDFEEVFKQGTRRRTSRVSLVYLLGTNDVQWAFVAAKRLGNAVYRNKCKRLLREAARGIVPIDSSLRVIIFATTKTIHTKPQDIRADILSLLRKEHITCDYKLRGKQEHDNA